MQDTSRRTSALIGYALVALVALAVGFGAVLAVTGISYDETLPVRSSDSTADSTTTTTTSTTSTTEGPGVDEIGALLGEVTTLEDALAVIEAAPQPPEPGVDVTIEATADVPAVAGSTAFLASSADIAELGEPFFPGSGGNAVRLPAGPKVVVMIALDEPIDEPTGVVVAAVIEKAGETAISGGTFDGATEVVAARLGRSDVIGGRAGGSGFDSAPLTGSVRVDGPLLTFVFEPTGPFRFVVARGFDDDLDNFSGPTPDIGQALPTTGLDEVGDIEALLG